MPLVNKTFSDIITFTRASGATYFDSAGVLQSAANDAPRFDYDPVTLVARGFLIEEQRTNTATYSTEFQNAVYLVGPVGDDVTITDNAVTSPDGTSNAATYIEGTASTSHSRFQRVSGLTADGVYTISLFVKYNSGSRGFALGFGSGTGAANLNSIDRCTARWDTLAAGPATATPSNGTIAVISTNAVDVGNGWFRLSMAFTFDTTNVNTSFAFGFGITSSSLAIGGPNGDGSSYSIYGFQLEAGAFPTSYIPTTTTALTRSDDVASVNTLSPWFNGTEGTLFGEFSSYASGARAIVGISDGTLNNRIQFFANAGDPYTIASRLVSGGTQTNPANTGSIAVGSIGKAAIAYAVGANQGATSVNGGVPTTSSPAAIAVGVNTLELGKGSALANMSGYLRRITYYPRRLSNTELQAITA